MVAVGLVALIALGGALMMQAKLFPPMFGPDPHCNQRSASMLISSGQSIKTITAIKTASLALLEAGTGAMVIGVAKASAPLVYLCETTDPEFEPEEFYCFADNIELKKEVA